MADIKLASAGDDIRLWDAAAGYKLIKQFNSHSGNISCLAWSHDNKAIASASTAGDKIVLTYPDIASHNTELALKGGRSCIAFNSMSRYMMGGGNDGIIHIWDLKTNKLKRSYKDHKSAVTSVAFNWNDTDIASGSEAGEVILYNILTGQGCRPLVAPKVQAIRQVQYSHFKKSLLGAVSEDGAVNLWDTNRRCLIHSFNGLHKAPAVGLSFSPLNEMLMMSIGLDKRIICYDVQNKKNVRTMMAESPLTSIDLHSDGVTLAVGSTRGKVYIYDLRQGMTPVHTLSAHTSSVQCLTFQHNLNAAKTDSGGHKAKPAVGSIKRPGGTANNINQNVNKSSKINNGVHGDINANDAVPQEQTNINERPEPVVNHAEHQDTDELFSPLRERLTTARWTSMMGRFTPTHQRATPGSPGRNASVGDIRSSDMRPHASPTMPRSSSEGVFSPIGNTSPRMADRGYPIGGSVPVSRASYEREPVGMEDRVSSQENMDMMMHEGRRVSADSQSECGSSRSSVQDQDEFMVPSEATGPRSQMGQTREQVQEGSHSAHGQGFTRTTSLPTVSAHTGAPAAVAAAMVAPSIGASVTGSAPNLLVPPGGGGAFQMDVVRGMIEDAMEELRDQVRRDILGLHVEMVKQFQIQQAETRQLLQQYSINDELMTEIERLREENKRLKQTF